MIANAAFLAAIAVFLFASWLAGELTFLASYKATLFRRHADVLGGGPRTALATAALITLVVGTANYFGVKVSGRLQLGLASVLVVLLVVALLVARAVRRAVRA